MSKLNLKTKNGKIILPTNDFELLMLMLCNQKFVHEGPINGDGLAMGEKKFKSMQDEMQEIIDENFTQCFNFLFAGGAYGTPDMVFRNYVRPLFILEAKKGWQNIQISYSNFLYIIWCLYTQKQIDTGKINPCDVACTQFQELIDNCYDQCMNLLARRIHIGRRQQEFINKYGYGG